MEQLRDMLGELGIRASVFSGRKNLRKNGTLSIANKLTIECSSFGNFYKQVGFDDSLKAEKLSFLAEATLSRCGGFLQ
ncbi:Uncharacterised protein [uncultured archaeon]|nr:Uncharacterised protein [uncultured archaeon]